MPTLKTPKAAISLQERDVLLLKGLFECRVMTNDHASMLYFNGRGEAAKKRLQKIKAAGLIRERPRHAFEPAILFLTRKGLESLQKQDALSQYPAFDLPVLDRRARVSNLTIRHELEVMDVKVAFYAAFKSAENFTITTFSTWPLLNEFKAYHPERNGAEALVKPDGFISVHENEAGTKGFARDFFLEVDRSSETQDVLIARVACYYDYYKSGGFAVRNGASRAEFKDYPFRILMVFKTAERRNNTAERLLQNNPPILTLAWLTTLEEVTTNPLGSIWIRPVEYREAVKGTSFENTARQDHWGYKRQTEREILVETKIQKRPILAGK